jgi:two-component system phosphate regulon sensor histidine kinase PhoR
MNKKRYLLTTIGLFLLTFLSYFAALLSVFLSLKNSCRNETNSLTTEIVSSLKLSTDYDAAISKYRGISSVRLSYFSEKEGDAPVSDSTSTYDKETTFADIVSKKGTVYFETSNSLDHEYCYSVTYKDDMATYIRVGIVVPSSINIVKNFLIYGSVVIGALEIAGGLYGFFRYNKSLVAIQSQTAKLQAVTEDKESGRSEDNLENLALMIRASRKKLDYQLQEAKTTEQKINFILDSFSQGLVVIDASCKIIMFNKKASEIFSLPKDKANGFPINVLTKGTKIQKNLSLVVKTLIPITYYENIEGRVYECDINPIDYSWIRVNEKSGASLLMFDVTENFNASKMKRDFFANASHELKSPLTSILGYQEMIKDEIITTPEETSDAINKTIKEAKRMRKIILNMLELSSLENESLRPIEQIDISKAIPPIVNSLEIELKEKNIKVIEHYEPLFIGINSDDVDKLVRNLLENAIKYNKDNGSIFITVSSKNKTLTVRDTGIGISEEDKTRIFERFYRVNKARSVENGGTGLGLAIVKYIANYYDYDIEVDSTLGKGSAFTIHLQ